MGYIYCITNLINSKRYVGKTTTTIEERWREHCQDSQKERCEKRPLYSAFKKYGIENFKIEELEYVENNSQLSNKEIYWIKELETYGSKGYNASKGGDGILLYDHNEIIELARLGYDGDQISKKLGCCKETIYKVIKANGVKIRSGKQHLIAQYDLAGNYIQTFWGSVEAQNWLINNGVTDSTTAKKSITKCCRKVLNSAYNYIWRYIPEPF